MEIFKNFKSEHFSKLKEDHNYLNHGGFGVTPDKVSEYKRKITNYFANLNVDREELEKQMFTRYVLVFECV